MTRSLAAPVVIAFMLQAGCGREAGDTGSKIRSAQASDATTTAEIRAVLDRYVKAVNDADENGVRELWARPDDVSYVNPIQRLRSWSELQGFWQGFLKSAFTRRELKPSNVAVHTVGDVAWGVFDWEFNATQADGKPYQSHGWETHVYQKTDRGWRISHVHYSVPATPPPASAQAGQ